MRINLAQYKSHCWLLVKGSLTTQPVVLEVMGFGSGSGLGFPRTDLVLRACVGDAPLT